MNLDLTGVACGNPKPHLHVMVPSTVSSNVSASDSNTRPCG